MKLKPCPKCGESLIELEEWPIGDNDNPAYRYRCANLDSWDVWFDTPEEAAEDWNKTPPTTESSPHGLDNTELSDKQ